MNNIYLIGMPGCGKSTIGKIISGEINMAFVDLDKYIVNTAGEDIEKMFEKGEPYFRARETECLNSISKLENTVIATGGGVVETFENYEIMKKTGRIVFIDTPPENIISNSSLSGRPLLAGNKNRIFDIYKRRYHLYQKFCDISVENNGKIEEVTEKVIKHIKKL